MSKNSFSIADPIKRELEKLSDKKRVSYKSGNAWIRCPYHGGGNEKTPSLKINLTSTKASIGSCYCFACGKNIGWNELHGPRAPHVVPAE